MHACRQQQTHLALDVEVLGRVVGHVLRPLARAQDGARVHHDDPAQRLQLLPRDAHVPGRDARHLEIQRRYHLRRHLLQVLQPRLLRLTQALLVGADRGPGVGEGKRQSVSSRMIGPHGWMAVGRSTSLCLRTHIGGVSRRGHGRRQACQGGAARVVAQRRHGGTQGCVSVRRGRGERAGPRAVVVGRLGVGRRVRVRVGVVREGLETGGGGAGVGPPHEQHRPADVAAPAAGVWAGWVAVRGGDERRWLLLLRQRWLWLLQEGGRGGVGGDRTCLLL